MSVHGRSLSRLLYSTRNLSCLASQTSHHEERQRQCYFRYKLYSNSYCKNSYRQDSYHKNSRQRFSGGSRFMKAGVFLAAVTPVLALEVNDSTTDSNPTASRQLARLILHSEERIDLKDVRQLLKDGADPNYTYEGGWRLVHVAAARGDVALMKMLIRFKADVNSIDEYSPNSRLGHVTQERLAMNSNFKVDVDWKGFSPLHYAVLNDDVGMVKVLIDSGAIVKARTRTGFLPSELAADKEIKQMLEDRVEVEKKNRIMSLGPFLKAKIVGQEEALSTVTAAVQRRDLGWQDDKPLVMLFVGSSGIGKTETAKQLAAHRNKDNSDSEVSFIRIDMSEFQERHEVSKFIGSPPGYIGHEDGGQLTKALSAHPQSVVLFDEVEKAHPDVLNIMLQLFDEGRLTDGKGETIVCPNAIFVMTTNVGADQIAASNSEIDGDFKKVIMYPLLKRAFKRNEFLGRINEIVYFHPFTPEECLSLVEIELKKIRHLAEKQNISLSWTPQTIQHLALSLDTNYGARSLKNEVSREVINKLADMNLDNRIKSGSKVNLNVVDGNIKFSVA